MLGAKGLAALPFAGKMRGIRGVGAVAKQAVDTEKIRDFGTGTGRHSRAMTRSARNGGCQRDLLNGVGKGPLSKKLIVLKDQ